MKFKFLVLIVGICLLSGTSAYADLYLRGMGTITSAGAGQGETYRLIYDSDENVTWFDYTSASDSISNQKDWVDALAVQDFSNTYSGWQLPTFNESLVTLNGVLGFSGPNPDGTYDYEYGYNMVNSALGRLFYETLANFGAINESGLLFLEGYGLSNTGPFENLQGTADYYWLDTPYSQDTTYHWLFSFSTGAHSYGADERLAIAFRSGDVAQDPDYSDYPVWRSGGNQVPIPAAVYLLGTGLLGLAGLRRKLFR